MPKNPNMLKELTHLQDAFNKKVNPQWLIAGYPFHRAIWMEAGELVEGTNGWKWWKGQSGFEKAQLQLEVIDILHFLISWAMVSDHIDNGPAATDELEATLLEIEAWQVPEIFNVRDVIDASEALVAAAANRNLSGAIMHFATLAHVCQLTPASMRKLYISKNALNTFRNKNGYKEGTYIKIWSGREDNQVMEGILDVNPDMSFNDLLKVLGDYYQTYALAPAA